MNDIIVGIGCGRDGTNSLALLVSGIFEHNGHDGTAEHQLHHDRIYNLWQEYCKTPGRFSDEVNGLLKDFAIKNAVIGNGYALILDQLRSHYGDHLKILHLQREKSAWIRSFKKNVATYPRSHGNYSAAEDPRIYRMAAWQFGECSADEWSGWSLDDKLSWFYDRSHGLIADAGRSSPNYLKVRTEELSEQTTANTIATFLDPSWQAPVRTFRANISTLDYEGYSRAERVILGRFYSQFDYLLAAGEPLYGEDFFATRVIKGYENRDTYEHSTVSREQLAAYARALKERLARVEQHLAKAAEEDSQ